MVPTLPLVSIITPSFNQGKFIAQTIDSVLAQNYPHIEYLVMDGGSRDETLSVLKGYGERVRWHSEPDEGQSQAINKGWQKARGEIVSWLNSDDLLYPDAVSGIVQAFQQHPEIVAAYGDGHYINQHGQVVGRYASRSWSFAELLKSATNFVPQPSLFVRRRVLEDAGWLDEKLHYVMDYELCLRLGKRGDIFYLPQTIAALRLHREAKSLSAVSSFGEELVRVIRQQFATLSEADDLRQLEPEAIQNVCFYAASCCFWSGDFARARAWLKESRQPPAQRSFSARHLRLAIAAGIGKPGLIIAEKLYGNPYTGGAGKSG